MAQLKDLIVNGASQLIGDVYTSQIQISKLNAPTAAGGSTYGAGSTGQALLSNGTSVYWGIPDLSGTYVKKSGDTMTGDLTLDKSTLTVVSAGKTSITYQHAGYLGNNKNTLGIGFVSLKGNDDANSTYESIAVNPAAFLTVRVPSKRRSDNTYLPPRFAFYERSLLSTDGSGSGGTNAIYEVYSLPAPNFDLSATASYHILTTKLHFTDKTVAVTDWSTDSTYSGFSWKADIACTGVSSNHVPNVIFDYNELISGNFCPFADSSSNTVTIYCKERPTAAITIPTIYCT